MKRKRTNRGLAFKLFIPVGIVLFASIFIWTHYSSKYREKQLIDTAVIQVDKFCNSVLKLTWFAMLHNPTQDMQEILNSMSEYNDIKEIRVFNCEGQIRFSNNPGEVGHVREKSHETCSTCHSMDPPKMKTDIKDRVRIFESGDGELLLGLINPIVNAQSCATSDCHYHPPDVAKLGSLDVIVSLETIRKNIAASKKLSAWSAVGLFLILAVTIGLVILFQVNRPITRLVGKTRRIAEGDFTRTGPHRVWADEIEQLSVAINEMGQKIQEKQVELNRQKDMYRHLFEQVPCTITVQNREYKLVEFNQEFVRRFNPKYGDYCYAAYKGLDAKCSRCPVEKTFLDGKSHFSEESGINKDGTTTHWFVKTAPLKDESGRVVAAMEMSLDITRRKRLEEEVRISEKKYQAIFKNIPNPVFILNRDDLCILDLNDAAQSVYGYERPAIKGRGFDMLFASSREYEQIKNNINIAFHERCVHVKNDDDHIYVNIWIRPAEFVNRNVLIVTTVDITVSVETEQQLIQAGKMATLGEMATGVAHELNQPLSVIKTASGFIARKINSDELIDRSILKTLSEEIESHVDRASRITSHMRLFGRKTVFKKEMVNINEVLKRAFDIFSQQLKLREIEVTWDLSEDLPDIQADPVRLEQVFINLLINARDAIVAKAKNAGEDRELLRRISLSTRRKEDTIQVKIRDTGTGIASAHISKIFEPFFTTKNVGEGTGLGLSISYGIIKESEGDIRVYNNRDGGATFVIVFNTRKGQTSHEA
ncbi:MAG: PAS domain S-box protein [Desulfotignum sp.]|nr:PAS domain S-box protein [Desulfotignum sp.]